MAPRDLARSHATGFSRSPEAARWNLFYLPCPLLPYHGIPKDASWRESELPISHHLFLSLSDTVSQVECVYGRFPQIINNLLAQGKAVPVIVVVSGAHALPADTTLPTIQVLLFARLLAERIASKGQPHLSQMINLLSRNRICSMFISSPVNVRLALPPLRSPLFLSNKFLLNGDDRLCTPKRQAPAPYSQLPVSRSGARHAKTSSYRAKNFRQAPPISIPPKEWICGTYL